MVLTPAFVANHAGSNGVTTTFTATLPTGTMIGDVLVTAIAYRNTVSWSTNNSLGTWTKLTNLTREAGNTSTTATTGRGSLNAFVHVYTGISPNLTFTASANANVWRQTTLAVRGINPANPIGNSVSTDATAATVTPNTTAITIGSNNFLIMIIAGGCDNTTSGYTAVGGNPATWTERHDALSTSGGDTTLSVATAIGNTLGGSTGVLQATCTNSSFHVIGVVELNRRLQRTRQRYIAGS
jgi:hypothetical protein